MNEIEIIKKLGKKFGGIKFEEKGKFLNLEFIYNSFKETDGVFLYEGEDIIYSIFFLSGEPIFKVLYENNNRLIDDKIDYKFLSKFKDSVNFYKLNKKGIIPILSLYLGETIYKDLDIKVIDFSQFIECLGEKKLTGILTISNSKSDVILIYDGTIVDIKEGEVVYESNLSIESESTSLVSFAKLIMMENAKISFYSIDKDVKLNRVNLYFLKFDINKIKENIKEIIRKILKERVKKIEDAIDTINSKEDIYKVLNLVQNYVLSLYNKKVYSDIESQIKNLIET